jgi:hypothetical protein
MELLWRLLLVGRHLRRHVLLRSHAWATLAADVSLLSTRCEYRHARGLLVLRRYALQGRLRGSVEQATSIGAGIVNELPVVVVILLVELPDRLLLGRAHNADNGTAAKYLSTQATRAARARLVGTEWR